MKDYYEILEVNKKASKEVIDKAYKVLAKKYHPDLQPQEKKSIAQRKMQEVNEAYEVLSDENKRKEYDETLDIEEKRKMEELLQKENYNRNQQQQYNEDSTIQYQQSYNQEEQINPFSKKEIKEQEKKERQRRRQIIEEEERRYRNYLRGLGYKVKEKWTWKRFFRLLKAIGIFAISILILWIIPPTRKLMIETYEENPIIQTIVKIISNVFIGMFNGIGVFFKQIFNIKK